jgi:hypothetical protein
MVTSFEEGAKDTDEQAAKAATKGSKASAGQGRVRKGRVGGADKELSMGVSPT